MGEDDYLNRAEIDPKSGDIALEGVLLWPSVEEDRVRALSTKGRDKARQAMSGTADAPA
jgi:hypothetical protein